MRFARLRTEHPDQVAPLLSKWLKESR
jgi:hypothetical protein